MPRSSTMNPRCGSVGKFSSYEHEPGHEPMLEGFPERPHEHGIQGHPAHAAAADLTRPLASMDAPVPGASPGLVMPEPRNTFDALRQPLTDERSNLATMSEQDEHGGCTRDAPCWCAYPA